jgi:hypothetical protein
MEPIWSTIYHRTLLCTSPPPGPTPQMYLSISPVRVQQLASFSTVELFVVCVYWGKSSCVLLVIFSRTKSSLPDRSLSFYILPLVSIAFADLLVRRTLNPFHFFVFFPHSRSYTYIHTVQYAAVRRIREILVRIRIRGSLPKFFCLFFF